MLWWTIRQLKSRNPETRDRAAQKLLQSDNREAIERWRPTDDTLRALRAFALRSWDLGPVSAIIPWLPLIIETVERNPPDPHSGHWNADRIEAFFSRISFKDTLPYLLRALESDVCVVTQELSKKTLEENEVREAVGGGSWNGSWEGYQDCLHRVVEHTFDTRNPVAEGAKNALIELGQSEPMLKPQIDAAIEKYLTKPHKTVTRIDIESELLGPSVVTHSEYDGH